MPNPRLHVNQKDVVSTTLDQEAVILNLQTKYYYTVNDTGLRIWELLTAGTSEDEIIETLMDEYEVSAEECRSDVQQMVHWFQKEALVVSS
jgi:hypothetical protein